MSRTGFSDFDIVWNGATYTIKSNEVMGAIAVLEDVISVDELHRQWSTKSFKRVQLCRAFCALLKYAGAKADEEEVYRKLFDKADAMTVMVRIIETLYLLMVPTTQTPEEAPKKKPASKKKSGS